MYPALLRRSIVVSSSSAGRQNLETSLLKMNGKNRAQGAVRQRGPDQDQDTDPNPEPQGGPQEDPPGGPLEDPPGGPLDGHEATARGADTKKKTKKKDKDCT